MIHQRNRSPPVGDRVALADLDRLLEFLLEVLLRGAEEDAGGPLLKQALEDEVKSSPR